MQKKQVDKDHYEFKRYISKERWASMWHQLNEVISLQPESVLEIGPGPGVFKTLAKSFGLHVETLDIDPELNPDHIASADDMPFEDKSYDVVCAFQMLEHVPYDLSLKIFSEMSRVARKRVIISLPDAHTIWSYSVYVPKIGQLRMQVARPLTRKKRHEFDGEHYWEINKLGYSSNKVYHDLQQAGRRKLEKSYRVYEFPYHHFLIFGEYI